MKRISAIFCLCLCIASLTVRAQDAATAAAIADRKSAEENYNVLKGHVDDLLASQADLEKRLQSLAKELEDVRQQASKPTGNFASQDALDKLAQAVRELDKKREDDKRLVLDEIEKLGKAISAPVSHSRNTPRETSTSDSGTKPAPAVDPNQPGFYYVVKKGDLLSLIAQAYRQQGIQVTTSEILAANPGLDASKLYVGKKIFIPSSKGAPK